MSVVNKGRGRGFTDSTDVPLRRPGHLPTKFKSLTSLIDGLFIQDLISGSKIDDIVQKINEAMQNDSLKEVINTLHKQALEDREFGIKLALAISDPKIYSINDCNLRLIMLQTLQKDYEDREDIKRESNIHFRNAISLLGEVYNDLKLNGKPIGILATPLLQYLELLLETAEEEDIELVTTQISINGRKIFEESQAAVESFIMNVRTVLIKRNISARSRGMLLFIIDLANQQFVPFTGKLQEFYINEIGTNTLVNIKHFNKNSSDGVKLENNLKTNVGDKSNLQLYTRPKNQPIQPTLESQSSENFIKNSKQGKNLGFGSNEKSLPNTSNDRPIPRAIRGAGATDNSKDKNAKKFPRGKKPTDKLTDEQIWSSKQNTSSKVWGHDDRFDKDYD